MGGVARAAAVGLAPGAACEAAPLQEDHHTQTPQLVSTNQESEQVCEATTWTQ